MAAQDRNALFWGSLLTILGVGFLLNNLRLVPAGVLDLWPLLIIGAGVWMLGGAVARGRGRGLVGGALVLTLGVYWLLGNYGLVTEQMLLPFILIGLGAGLLLRTLAFRPRA